MNPTTMNIALLPEHKSEYSQKSNTISIAQSGTRQAIKLSDTSLKAIEKAIQMLITQAAELPVNSDPSPKFKIGRSLLSFCKKNVMPLLQQRQWRKHRVEDIPHLQAILEKNLPDMDTAKRLRLSSDLNQHLQKMALDENLTNQYVSTKKLMKPQELINAIPSFTRLTRSTIKETPENVDFYLEKSPDGSVITAQIYGKKCGGGFYKTIFNSKTITIFVQKNNGKSPHLSVAAVTPTVLVRSRFSKGSESVCEPLRGLNLVRSRFLPEELERDPNIKISSGLSKLRLRPTVSDIILEGEDKRFASDLTIAMDNMSVVTTNKEQECCFDIQKALQALVSTTKTLTQMHNRCLVHRDISGRNILLNDSLEAYLADFDLCVESGSYTLPGGMYNDALEEKGLITPLTDIFAVAMTLGRLLFGRSFYRAINRMEGRLFDQDIEGHSVLNVNLVDKAVQQFCTRLTELGISTQFFLEQVANRDAEAIPAFLVWKDERKHAIATMLSKYEEMSATVQIDPQCHKLNRAIADLDIKLKAIELIDGLLQENGKTLDFVKNNPDIARRLSDPSTSAITKRKEVDLLLNKFPFFRTFFNELEGLLKRWDQLAHRGSLETESAG